MLINRTARQQQGRINLKTLLKKRVLLISVIAAILALVIGGIVLADTVITVPGQINVVAPTYDIEVFSDAACTIPLTSVIWASDIPQGGERTETVYVKNVGNMDDSVLATLVNAPSGVSLVNDTILVPRGESEAFDLELQATATAQIGATQKFTITFTSSALPTTTTTTTSD